MARRGRLDGRRRGDRRHSLICHWARSCLLPVALLAATMGAPPRLGLLVTAIGRLSLSPPSGHATGHGTVALSTVACTAYREHRAAFGFLALFQAGWHFHQEQCQTPRNYALQRPQLPATTGLMIGRMIAPTARTMLLTPGGRFRKLRFQMIADTALGYRRDRDRHKDARLKVTARRRKQIAKLGMRARRARSTGAE